MQQPKTAAADHLAAITTIVALALAVPFVGVLMIPVAAFGAVRHAARRRWSAA